MPVYMIQHRYSILYVYNTMLFCVTMKCVVVSIQRFVGVRCNGGGGSLGQIRRAEITVLKMQG